MNQIEFINNHLIEMTSTDRHEFMESNICVPDDNSWKFITVKEYKKNLKEIKCVKKK